MRSDSALDYANLATTDLHNLTQRSVYTHFLLHIGHHVAPVTYCANPGARIDHAQRITSLSTTMSR